MDMQAGSVWNNITVKDDKTLPYNDDSGKGDYKEFESLLLKNQLTLVAKDMSG